VESGRHYTAERGSATAPTAVEHFGSTSTTVSSTPSASQSNTTGSSSWKYGSGIGDLRNGERQQPPNSHNTDAQRLSDVSCEGDL